MNILCKMKPDRRTFIRSVRFNGRYSPAKRSVLLLNLRRGEREQHRRRRAFFVNLWRIRSEYGPMPVIRRPKVAS